MSDKKKHPRAEALKVAKELCDELRPYCDLLADGKPALIVAGSLRRRKELVGDVEILFIPKFRTLQNGLFSDDLVRVDCVAEHLQSLIARGVIQKRLTVMGSESWGAKNKYAVHIASGIPVDFFTATQANWFNYLVCRTGGAENNTVVAGAAIKRGWRWNPYGAGFVDERGNEVPVSSEREVYELAKLPYREPWERL